MRLFRYFKDLSTLKGITKRTLIIKNSNSKRFSNYKSSSSEISWNLPQQGMDSIKGLNTLGSDISQHKDLFTK